MKKCEHKGKKVINYDHIICKDCWKFGTDGDRSWGIAKNRWFDSEDIAKFYRDHGRLPEEVE